MMGIAQAIARPTKCHLVNQSTGGDISCLFNPSQLSEKVKVNWNRLNVPGLPHQVLQYQSTGNRQLSGVEFYLDRFFAKQQNTPDIMKFREFLLALTVPSVEGGGYVASAPPRTRIIWPGLLSLESVLTSVDFQYQQFAQDGSVLVYSAICDLEEINDVRTLRMQGGGF